MLRRITLNGFANPEGVAVLENGNVAVVDERRRNLSIFELNPLTRELDLADGKPYDLGYPDAGNKGFEGIAWDPTQQRLLLGMHKGAGLLSRAKVTRMGLGKYRVPYSALLLLCDLGLMHRGELESGPLPADGVELAFGNQRWRLRQRQSNLTLLYYRLTPIGNELALLLEEPPLEEYLQDLKTLLSTNLQIETLMLAPAGEPDLPS